MLQQLGLVQQPKDLDLVCTEAAYPVLARQLAGELLPLAVTAHPQYCSRYFSRYQSADGTELELIAGVQVKRAGEMISWPFDPALISRQQGLPWMTAQQWLQLYQLFNRPARLRLLQTYLAQSF